MLKNGSQVNSRHDGILEFPSAYGRDDAIRLEKPLMYIQLGKKPVKHVLSFGPGVIVPLPIIPWPPGIIASLFNRKSKGSGSEKVEISLLFPMNEYSNEVKAIMLNGHSVALNSGGSSFYPSTVTCKGYKYAYEKGALNKKNIEGCFIEDGEGMLTIPSEPNGKCSEVVLTLKFDLPYDEIVNEAVLEIGDVRLNENSCPVPKTFIQKKRKFKLWWAYTINT